MQEFMDFLQSFSFAQALRESALMYPIIMSLHLTGMGLFGGMILLTDLRILGVAFTKQPVADVHNQLRAFKHLGLTLVVTCGLLLGISKAGIYWPNPYFKLKLTLLLAVAIHALIFRGSVYSHLEEYDRTGVIPGNAKLAAAISLLLWLSLVTAGRWIGYWEPPTA
jgi:hypothetical protein